MATTATTENSTSRNADGVVTIKVSVSGGQKKYKTSFFYVDLASRYLKDNEQIELSGLGYAEILKSQGIADIKRIRTTTTAVQERRPPKPKIEVLLQRSANFEQAVKNREEQAAENKALREQQQKAQAEFQEKLKAQSKS